MLVTFNCIMCRRKSILIEDLFKLNVKLDLQVFDEDFDHWVNIDQSYKPDDKEKKLHVIEDTTYLYHFFS